MKALSLLAATLVACALPMALAACGNNNFEKPTQLRSLRILALQADQPEVNAGTTVTIKPLITDIQGGGRALTYSAEACTDPGVGLAADPSCDRAADRAALATSVPATPTALVAAYHTGEAPTFNVTVPAAFLASYSAEAQLIGVNYLVLYRLSAADGTTTTAFRRIVVTSALKSPKNTNPTLAAVQSDGATLTALPRVKAKFRAVPAAGAAESYTLYSLNGAGAVTTTTKAEELTTSWIISDGEMKFSRTVGTDTSEYTPPIAIPTDRGVLVIAITRDERGGVTWQVTEPCGAGGMICPP